MSNMFHFGRLSIDYNINNRNTITAAGNFVKGNFNTSDVQNYEYLMSDKTPISNGYRINDSKAGFVNYTSQLMYKKTYPRVGKELTVDANHNYSESANGYQFNSYDKDIAGNELPFRSEEHTSELQSLRHLVCRLLLEKKKIVNKNSITA